MKRPYLTEWERQLIRLDTTQGAVLHLNLRWKILCREVSKEFYSVRRRVLRSIHNFLYK